MKNASQVGTPGIATPLASLRSIKVRLPPISEQRAISALLGVLDDKIELNRQMNDTLEATARAIFKSWFIDFDPVRGTATAPEDIRGLFPDRLVDSPLGPMLEGWEVAPLGEHVEVTRGLSYSGSALADKGMPLHNLNSVLEGGGYKYGGIKHYAGEYRARDLVEPGDVIVANTEQGHRFLLIGCPALVPRTFGEQGLFSHHLYRVRPAPARLSSGASSTFCCSTLGCTQMWLGSRTGRP
jgi:type I restriction enzyme S subunit